MRRGCSCVGHHLWSYNPISHPNKSGGWPSWIRMELSFDLSCHRTELGGHLCLPRRNKHNHSSKDGLNCCPRVFISFLPRARKTADTGELCNDWPLFSSKFPTIPTTERDSHAALPWEECRGYPPPETGTKRPELSVTAIPDFPQLPCLPPWVPLRTSAESENSSWKTPGWSICWSSYPCPNLWLSPNSMTL